MAVAHDAATDGGTFTTTSPHTFNHTPSGTPRGVVVAIAQNGTASDLIDGTVSYGGVAMTRIAEATDTAGEPGGSYLYFLGESIPTGTQTVSISHTGSANTKWAAVATITAASDTEITAASAINESFATTPVVSIGSSVEQIGYSVYFSGTVSTGTSAQSTTLFDQSMAASTSANFSRMTTPASGDWLVSYAVWGNDDVACSVLGIREVSALPTMAGIGKSGVSATGTTITARLLGDLDGRDLYMCVISRDSTSASSDVTCTDDSGANTWTAKTSDTDKKLWVFHKKGTGADYGALITVANCVNSSAGTILVINGGDTGDPTNGLTLETNASGDETHAAITPADPDSIVVFVIGDYGNDTNVPTAISGATIGSFTEVEFDLSTAGSDCRVTVAVAVESGGPSTTGNVTWTQTNSTTKTALFAVSPAPAVIEVDVGTAPEVEVANPIDPVKPIFVDVLPATETELARPIDATLNRLVDIGTANEIESAQGIEARKAVDVGTAVEVEIPGSMGISRSVPVNPATEAEIATAMEAVKPILVNLGLATEQEIALAMTPDVSQPILVDVGVALERELALVMTPDIAVPGFIGDVICDMFGPSVLCDHLGPAATCDHLGPLVTCDVT